jgi:hypothetical protein
MADPFELVALGLPADVAPDALPDAVKRLVAECWPGMSRAQLVARARRRALQPSLRAAGDHPGAAAPGGDRVFQPDAAGRGRARAAHRASAAREAATPVGASGEGVETARA